MIPVESLLYKLDQRLNKLSTLAHQQIPVEDKILLLNEGQLKLIKHKVSPQSNPLHVGFEGSNKRYQDLQFLVEPPEKHPLKVREGDQNTHCWKASLSDLDPKFLFYIDAYVLADKGPCKGRVIWLDATITPHADVRMLLQNASYRPSFEYQESFCDISTDELWFYTDGSFTPTQLFCSYLRYPTSVDYSGYEHFDGSPSKTINCELPLYLEDELLDIVEADIARYTENVSAYQAASQSKASNE